MLKTKNIGGDVRPIDPIDQKLTTCYNSRTVNKQEKHMDINVVKSAIMLNNYSNQELNELTEALRYARAQLAQQVKRSMCIGDNVNFYNSKTGQNLTGVVMKIAIKYVTVRSSQGLWRVPASMLTVV